MLTIILVECSVEEMMDESFNFVPIDESLFTLFASLTYAYHYLMKLIK